MKQTTQNAQLEELARKVRRNSLISKIGGYIAIAGIVVSTAVAGKDLNDQINYRNYIAQRPIQALEEYRKHQEFYQALNKPFNLSAGLTISGLIGSYIGGLTWAIAGISAANSSILLNKVRREELK